MTICAEVEVDPYEILDEISDDAIIKEFFSRGLEEKVEKELFESSNIDEVKEYLWNYMFHKSKEEIEKIKDVVDFHYKQWERR